MAIDLEKQRQALEARLAYYREAWADRPEAYRQFKAKHSIPRIHAAIARIDAGTYGICATCGDMIDDERLILVPGALHCRDCQAALETGKGKGGRPPP